MEKKEILALIAAVSAVLLLIFIMTKVRGEEEQTPAGSIYADPAQLVETGAPETDIWDVIHAMNTTETEQPEGETVPVTAVGENGEIYTVTDDQGNTLTETGSASAPSAETSAVTEEAPANDKPGEVPVINITPGQTTANEQGGNPYFVVVTGEP